MTIDSNEPKGNYAETIEFLLALYPDGPWCLSAIHPDRKNTIETKTFSKGEWDDLQSWLVGHSKWNLHFHVNEVAGNLKSKASKEDIARVWYLHVDIDPRKGVDLDGEQQRIQAMLSEESIANLLLPQPTFVIFSGGGYQAFWRMETPWTVDDNAEEVERYNKQIALLFGADNCHTIDHLMRLPGTVNWPNASKRESGRVPALARLIRQTDTRYAWESFTKAPRTAAVPEAEAPPQPTSVERVTNLDDLNIPGRIKVIIAQGRHPDEPDRPSKRSGWLWACLLGLANAGIAPEVAFAIITDPNWGISESVRERRNSQTYAWEQVTRAYRNAQSEIIIRPSATLSVARQFQQHECPDMIYLVGQYLAYTGAHYEPRSPQHVRSDVTKWLESKCYYMRPNPTDKKLPPVKEKFEPYTKHSNDVLGMLQDATLNKVETLPCWRGENDWNPSDVILLSNCLLNARTGERRDHTPDFVSTNLVPVAFDPNATCPTWEHYLDQWLPDQPEERALLQEWFGYNLVCNTSMQKALMIVGATRSGKGTMAWTMSQLVGVPNVATPSLKSLAETFGLEQLLHKTAAVVGDARVLGSKNNLTEIILGITGEDGAYVNQKGIKAATGVKINTRFTVLSNKLIAFHDTTGVIASRFLYIVQKPEVSYYGKEDLTIKPRLSQELSGILNWALEGLRRLTANGRFTEPGSSSAIKAEMARAASPFESWWDEATALDETGTAHLKSQFFASYQSWCKTNGYIPENARSFEQDMAQKVRNGEIREARPRIDGARVYAYLGRGLICDVEWAKASDYWGGPT